MQKCKYTWRLIQNKNVQVIEICGLSIKDLIGCVQGTPYIEYPKCNIDPSGLENDDDDDDDDHDDANQH